jgi:oxygen-dependent protoporphyrinogen oxidase
MTKSGSESAWRVAVVGGGVSGLAAAHRLVERCRANQVPLELSLFEAGSRLGGTVETRSIDGYLVERGADSFLTAKPWMTELCRRVGLGDEIVFTQSETRRSLVLRRGKPVAVPDGFNLLAPARIAPVLRSPLFSPRGKLRMLFEAAIRARSGDADESIASFARRRFGNEAWERLLQPLVGGIYTANPEKLSLLATFPRFREMERQYGSLTRAMRSKPSDADDLDESASGARFGLFATLAGGLGTLVERLSERIGAAGDVRLNTAVNSMRGGGPDGEWTLLLSDGSSARFNSAVVAVPAYGAASLLETIDPELGRLLGQIEYASSAVVCTGHRLSDVGHPLDAFGLVVPKIENRNILAVSFASRKFPGRAPEGSVLLRTFVGGALQPELLAKSDDAIVEIVRRELADIFQVRGSEAFALVGRFERAMPQYEVGHLERVAAIERCAARHRGLELAGNAYRGVGLPDCIHSGERAAERLLELRRLSALQETNK